MATCITDNKEKKIEWFEFILQLLFKFWQKKYCLIKNSLSVNKYMSELINNINEAYQF